MLPASGNGRSNNALAFAGEKAAVALPAACRAPFPSLPRVFLVAVPSLRPRAPASVALFAPPRPRLRSYSLRTHAPSYRAPFPSLRRASSSETVCFRCCSVFSRRFRPLRSLLAHPRPCRRCVAQPRPCRRPLFSRTRAPASCLSFIVSRFSCVFCRPT